MYYSFLFMNSNVYGVFFSFFKQVIYNLKIIPTTIIADQSQKNRKKKKRKEEAEVHFIEA